MEKLEVIQKRTLQSVTIYRLISITSDWYSIISLVIDINFICFLICIDFTAKYAINGVMNYISLHVLNKKGQKPNSKIL